MRRVVCLVTLLLHTSPVLAQSTGQPPAQGKRTIRFTASWEAPPDTLAGNWTTADAVVLGTVQRNDVRPTATGHSNMPISGLSTLSDVLVVEVFKGDHNWAGKTIQVREHAGTYEDAEVIARTLDSAMDIGGQYVLFLSGSRGEWHPKHGPFSVYALQAGRVAQHTMYTSTLGRSSAIATANDFIRDLRRLRDNKETPHENP